LWHGVTGLDNYALETALRGAAFSRIVINSSGISSNGVRRHHATAAVSGDDGFR
jgi:hypothetical protein